MYVTWNFILALFSYTILLLLLPTVGLIYCGVLLLIALWLIDLWLTRIEPKLQVTRMVSDPVYHHRDARVDLEIFNPSGFSKRVMVKDEPPFEVEVIGGVKPFRVNLPAGATTKISYHIHPLKRGLFRFGAVNLKYPGRCQLFMQQYPLNLDQNLKVLPNLEKIFDSGLAKAPGADQEGIHRRKIFSMHGEFSQLREFVPGDDYRKVNWKVTAHIGKPVVNEFEPIKDQNVFLLLDTGRLLFDQINMQSTRLDYVLDSAILLAYNVMQYGDMVGALGFDAEVSRYVPIGKGHRHLQLLVEKFYDLEALMIESDYREAFQFWHSRVNKRCLLFLYTDLSDPESSKELITHLQILSRSHLIVCVLLRQTSLTGLARQPITDERSAFRKGVALELLAERQRLKRLLSNSGIRILETDPGNIRRTVVEHYVLLKKQGLF